MAEVNGIITAPQEISNDEYHNGDKYKSYISSTSLKNYLLSPLQAKYLRENPKGISLEASIKGSVYHDLLSSLANRGDFSEFNESYFVFEPPINERSGKAYGIDTKAYRSELELQKALNPGKEVCSGREVMEAKKMIQHLRNGDPLQSAQIEKFLKYGKAEQSHFCHYNGYGFKFRTDLKLRSSIVDWKSVADDDLSDDNIAKTIMKFKYHISAAFYQFFNHVITGRWFRFYWVFQSKVPPYDFRIVSADEWAYDFKKSYNTETKTTETFVFPKIGAFQFIELRDEHIYCTQNDFWPGQAIRIKPDFKGLRINSPAVPGYAKSKELNFYTENND